MELFVLLCEAIASVHGAPLPKGSLSIGECATGWHVELNNSEATFGSMRPHSAFVMWNGFPAGIIGPTGGAIAAGELANQDTFADWLREIRGHFRAV